MLTKNNKYILLTFLATIIYLLFATASLAQTNTLLSPPSLNAGDTVGLISSGFRVPEDQQIQFASERLQTLGLKVKYGRSVFHRDGYFAGRNEERAADINEMFADPQVKAIFELRGGWGSNLLLNKINYQLIKQHPKIIIGYSDITSLLLAIHAKTGLVTFHGPLVFDPMPAFTTQYLKDVLFTGKAVVFQNPVDSSEDDLIHTENRIQLINGGTATGPLLGGNLTTLTSMLGSPYLPNFKGSILFVEDVGENVYQIDRMLTQLKMAGILNQISGVVFGTFKDCAVGSGTTSYGSLTLKEVLDRHIKPLHIPAWYGAMIGHETKIFTLPEGTPVTINADQGTITMLEPGVKVPSTLSNSANSTRP